MGRPPLRSRDTVSDVELELGRHLFDVSTHALVMAEAAAGAVEPDVLLASGDAGPSFAIVAASCGGPVAVRAEDSAAAQAFLSSGASLILDATDSDAQLLAAIADAEASVLLELPPSPEGSSPLARTADRIRVAQSAGIPTRRVIVEAPPDLVREFVGLGCSVMITTDGGPGAQGVHVAAVMAGARMIRCNEVQPTARTLYTIGELLERRGVGAPDQVNPVGAKPCQ